MEITEALDQLSKVLAEKTPEEVDSILSNVDNLIDWIIEAEYPDFAKSLVISSLQLSIRKKMIALMEETLKHSIKDVVDLITDALVEDIIRALSGRYIIRALSDQSLLCQINEPLNPTNRIVLALKRCRMMAEANNVDFSEIKERVLIRLQNSHGGKPECTWQKA